ncbi:collagen-like protein [Streptomyces sp. NPDC056486]|uniref:collagen-like protein n=1 Tax=Streptomyces sp. NPDC056486 TaxID=3345835 RepID=UPI0036819B24
MIQLERVLAHRWRSVFLVCVLVALSGVAALLWARIDAGDRRADRLSTEADRRGEAVSTLARDVRTLRAQVRAHGDTPAAPDPSDAVDDLLTRVRVPASAPGSPGADGADGTPGEQGTRGTGGRNGDRGAAGGPGRPGSPGRPGPTGAAGSDGTTGEQGPEGPAGAAGPSGSDGADGADGSHGSDGAGGASGPTGPQGPAGPAGPRGERGPKGETGDAGSPCPGGYSLQQPPGDPDALVCRRDGVTPADPAPALLLLPALLPRCRRMPGAAD